VLLLDELRGAGVAAFLQVEDWRRPRSGTGAQLVVVRSRRIEPPSPGTCSSRSGNPSDGTAWQEAETVATRDPSAHRRLVRPWRLL
jgi:hypothetical protein